MFLSQITHTNTRGNRWRTAFAGAAILALSAGVAYAQSGPASAPAGQASAAPAPASQASHDEAHDHEAAAFHGLNHAVAELRPTAGSSVSGMVHFAANPDGSVKVMAHVTGLAPNSTHGFHIHAYGDCSAADGKSAGGHYNPAAVPHALPMAGGGHAGDLGNLKADAAGMANFEGTFSNITIAGTKNPVVGRAVIVHVKPDDGGQPTGNAGARAACGVIGIGQSQ